jgi:GT2 family glycosyltransferase
VVWVKAIVPSSVIICSRNRPRLLLETVESILQCEPLPAEIVVVDQSDQDSAPLDRLQDVPGCDVRYLWSPSQGLSRARNEGAAAARHEILVYCDDDMRASASWIGALVGALAEAGPDAAASGKVVAGAPEAKDGFTPAVAPGDEPLVYSGRLDIDVLAGCNMGMYRSAFDNLGGFDERLGAGARYPAAEDNDFGFRLLEGGYRILYVPEAIMYHRAWRAGPDYPRVRWQYGRGKGGFYAKHLSSSDGHMLRRARKDVARRLLRLPRVVWRSPRLAAGDALYTLGIFAGGTSWLISNGRAHTGDGR